MDEKYGGMSQWPKYYNHAVKAALPALEYVAKKAYGHYRSKRKFKESYNRAVKRSKYRNAKKGKTVVKIDGTTGGQYRMATRKRRRRRKKSLKQQVQAVRKLIPKKSVKVFRDFNTIVLPGSFNSKTVYDITCFTNLKFDEYAANVTGVDTASNVDYRASNTSLQYQLYYKLMIKNNMTANCRFQYAFFVCKDDDTESPVDSIKEELEDRGYVVNPVVAEAPATATTSIIPRHIIHDEGNYHLPTFCGGALGRNWRQIGKVKSTTIGPGDTTDLVLSRKITYKPEIRDQENFTYISNYDTRLVIEMMGDLGHDNTNNLKIGRCSYQFDCEQQRQCRMIYGNPKGLNEVVYTDDLTATGFTLPVHADNHQSKIETDET